MSPDNVIPVVQMKFHDLDAEFISATTMKYQKAMGQLEKGLPPNGVLPVLKEKIENMREKIAVITDLRNDALKVMFYWSLN